MCTKLAWCLCSVVWACVTFHLTVLRETIWRHLKEAQGNVSCTFKHSICSRILLSPTSSLPLFLRSPPSHSDTDSCSKRNKNFRGNWTVTPFPLVVSAPTCRSTGVSSIVTFWEVLELTTHTSSRGQDPSSWALTLNKKVNYRQAEVSQNFTLASLKPKPGFWYICSLVWKDAT